MKYLVANMCVCVQKNLHIHNLNDYYDVQFCNEKSENLAVLKFHSFWFFVTELCSYLSLSLVLFHHTPSSRVICRSSITTDYIMLCCISPTTDRPISLWRDMRHACAVFGEIFQFNTYSFMQFGHFYASHSRYGIPEFSWCYTEATRRTRCRIRTIEGGNFCMFRVSLDLRFTICMTWFIFRIFFCRKKFGAPSNTANDCSTIFGPEKLRNFQNVPATWAPQKGMKYTTQHWNAN